MRIAHFIQRYPPALGGSEAYFARLSRFLAKKGDQVHIFTSNAVALDAFWSRSGATLPPGVSAQDDVEVHRYGLLRWPGRRYLLKPLSLIPHRLWQCLTLPCNPICPAMWRDAGSGELLFDVVHAAAFPYAFPIVCARRLSRRLGVPFFITPFLHLGDPADPNDPTRRAYLAKPLSWLLREADGVFVQTPSEREAALGLGIATDKVVLQGLGVDPAECTGGDRQAARRSWSVAEQDVVIGHLANLSREKGSTELLIAWRQLVARGVAAPLILAGPEMPNFARRWRMVQESLAPTDRPRVQRLGILSDQQKRDFFAGIDIFALPSRSDSFGLVLLEAWANRKPVVAYRAGGVADLVRHQLDGLLTPCERNSNDGAYNGKMLSDALELLIRDPATRESMGAAGHERVAAEFRWPEKLALVRRTYQQALASSHSSTTV